MELIGEKMALFGLTYILEHNYFPCINSILKIVEVVTYHLLVLSKLS